MAFLCKEDKFFILQQSFVIVRSLYILFHTALKIFLRAFKRTKFGLICIGYFVYFSADLLLRIYQRKAAFFTINLGKIRGRHNIIYTEQVDIVYVQMKFKHIRIFQGKEGRLVGNDID